MTHHHVTDDALIHSADMPVTVAHINYSDHLGVDSLMLLLQETRMQFLTQHGMKENNLDNQIGYVISKVNIELKQQAFHGDELIVQIYSPGFKNNSRGFTLKYHVIKAEDQSTIAQASTRQIFYDYAEKKTARTPLRFYSIMHCNLRLIQLPLESAA